LCLRYYFTEHDSFRLFELAHEKMTQQTNQRYKKLTTRGLLFLIASLLIALPGTAQTPGRAPTLSIAAVPLTTAQRTSQTMVNLNFRVPSGYHINSNTPKSEFLIPTALKMDLPTDIILGKIEYPAGEERSFPFSPDEKLSVYSGEFTIAVGVHPLHSVVPGKYVMHGVLRYQACDNAACYPPKNLPVSFEVKVVKEPPEHHANPAQSPHVHN
jgi:Disulphide bond corrector protein DsbC